MAHFKIKIVVDDVLLAKDESKSSIICNMIMDYLARKCPGCTFSVTHNEYRRYHTFSAR